MKEVSGKMRKIVKCVMLSVCVLASAGMLLGCGGKKQEEKTEEKKEEALKSIGKEEAGEGAYKVILENSTGKDIIGMSVKDSSMEEYPENMLAESDVFKKGEKRNLFYKKTVNEEIEEDVEQDTPVLELQYDIQITFDDGTIFILSAFPFEDIKEGKICFAEEVAFVEYKSESTKQSVSTKEAELAIKAEAKAAAEAEAKAAAEAEAKAAEEAKAAAEAEAAQQWQQQQQVQQPVQQQPVQQPSGGSEGCLDGGLVW